MNSFMVYSYLSHLIRFKGTRILYSIGPEHLCRCESTHVNQTTGLKPIFEMVSFCFHMKPSDVLTQKRSATNSTALVKTSTKKCNKVVGY